jgi:hypothetical protein
MTKANKTYIVLAVIAIILIGGAFYGGMVFGQKQKRNFGQIGQNPNISIRANKQGGGFNVGQIIAKDDKSITISIPTGGSKIIFFSASTEVSKFAKGDVGDLIIGQNVGVNGTTNTDGSVTATTIQLRPNLPKP